MSVELTTPVLVTIRADTEEEAQAHLSAFLREHAAEYAPDARLRISTGRIELNR